jgi:hypothetical protein
MKIWLNFDHSKVPNSNLIIIFEGRLSHKVYYLMLHHILSHYRFGMEFYKTFLFSTINKLIIIGLMYNQFQILNLISFIIHYKCPKKGHFAKMGTMIQKVSHHNVHSPLH